MQVVKLWGLSTYASGEVRCSLSQTDGGYCLETTSLKRPYNPGIRRQIKGNKDRKSIKNSFAFALFSVSGLDTIVGLYGETIEVPCNKGAATTDNLFVKWKYVSFFPSFCSLVPCTSCNAHHCAGSIIQSDPTVIKDTPNLWHSSSRRTYPLLCKRLPSNVRRCLYLGSPTRTLLMVNLVQLKLQQAHTYLQQHYIKAVSYLFTVTTLYQSAFLQAEPYALCWRYVSPACYVMLIVQQKHR